MNAENNRFAKQSRYRARVLTMTNFPEADRGEAGKPAAACNPW